MPNAHDQSAAERGALQQRALQQRALQQRALDQRVHDRRWLTLLVLCFSLLVIVIDNTIVNVALPTLVRDLGTSVSDLQWVVDAYTLVFAGLLLTAGSLGDRFGRKGALTLGLVIFGGASAAAAFAGGVTPLIAARAVMGIGAALIMPATLSILTNVFTDTRERALAIGLWSGVAGIAVALGPVTGGFLLDHFWWGSVFIVNVPIVIAALVAGRFLVPTSRNPQRPRIDVVGAGLSIVALGALVASIIEAPSNGWTDPLILTGFAVAVGAMVAFVLWERHVEEPMLDVRFFANARFSAASVNVTLVFFALFGFIFLATQYLQFVLGYSAFDAGLRTLPFAGALMLMAPLSSKAVQWFGTKRVVVTGMLVFASGLVVASTSTVTSGYPRVMVAMILMGAGMGLSVAPATESIMGSLPLHQAGVGSAVNDTSREVGGALGVAIVGSMLSSLYASSLNSKLPANVPTQVRDAADQSVGAALQVSAQLGRVGAPLADAARESFVYAMSRASLVTAGVAVVGALLAWRFLPARASDAETLALEVDGVDATDEPELVEVG
jgi:MFS transporter, DHA2 family, multidrug resistance protein